MGLRTQRNGPAVTNPVVSPRLTPMRHNAPIVSCDHTITAIAAAMSPAPGTIQGRDGLKWGPSCEPMVARRVAPINLTSARQLNSEATQDLGCPAAPVEDDEDRPRPTVSEHGLHDDDRFHPQNQSG